MSNRSEDLRNVALFGPAGAGKTALIDALAFATKAVSRHGNTADGSSVGDTQPEEKERKQTLTSHLFSFDWEKTTLNFVDTPGHSDFQADVYSAFGVVEAAVLCINANTGLTFHGRRLFAEAGRAGIGRAIVLTHPDGENANFEEVLADLNDALGDTVVPVTYPDADAAGFTTVHDVMSGDGPNAETHKEKLEERVAEADDEVLERYLESMHLSPEEFEKYLPIAISKQKVTPLFTVCGPREIGLKKLCSFLTHYFPSPAAYGGRPGGESGDEVIESNADQTFVGRVFKTIVDPYVGRQSFVRCLRGTLTADAGFLNVRTEKHEKLGGLQVPRGVEHTDTDKVVPGDLFIVAKVEDLALGDVVTADGAPIAMPAVPYPSPTYSLAVNPATRGDEQKINQGLEKLSAEDPTFSVRRDAMTGELVISGASPLHLEVQLGRLERRYGVKTEQHAPAIPFKETITLPAEGHHRHKKQSGGRGQFAEVYLRVRPLDRGEGFQFKDSVVGGSIPRQFIPEVEKGVRHLMTKGFLAGSSVEDVEAEVYDGKFHDVDSDQLSFQLAAERAVHDAFAKAKPILLEPIVEVTIEVPERFTGDVSSNLATLRGRMSGMEMQDGIQTIKANVPLKEMQDYSTQLRSMTQGEGSFAMVPSHYEPMPANVQQEIMAEHKAQQEHK